MDYALKLEGVSKRYEGSDFALDKISFALPTGTIMGFVGENGAGKSTLMNILYGLYQADEGTVQIDGEPVEIKNPGVAIAKGIGMVHQHFMLVEAMTVFENIILGDRNTRGIFIDREARRKEILELAEAAMKAAGVEHPTHSPIRGGTDGSVLTYKGLLCPNLPSAGHNAHGRYEYAPVESLKTGVKIVKSLVAPQLVERVIGKKES